MTQPPSTEGPHPDGASTYRRRTLARDAITVGSIVAVGASWLFLPQTVDLHDSYLLAALVVMTVALAVVFGASMSAVRGFVTSAVLAAVVATTVVVTFDVPRPEDSGYGVLGIWLLAFAMLIVVPLAWFGGAVVGWVWRSDAGR